MENKQDYIAVGTMSGTSMDGVDVAMIKTNGVDQVQSLGHVSVTYPPEVQSQLKHMAHAVAVNSGDVKAAQQACEHWDDTLQQLTQYHAQAIQTLIQQAEQSVDVIGFHGQTLFHAPDEGLTIQVGDVDYLLQQLQKPVVHQFRLQDVAAGGQGAPLAPAYHQALVLRDQLAPAAVINCGGIANVSWVTGEGWDQVRASDVGPGNGLLDRLVMIATHERQHYDKDGLLAEKGQLDQALLDQLWQNAVCGDSYAFADKPWPKSLDIFDLQLPEGIALQGRAFYDACYTITYFTAGMLVKALVAESRMTGDEPMRIILTGGGWNNPVLLNLFNQLVSLHLPHAMIVTCEELQWQSQAVEAEIFAYLAVRRLLQLPASGPYTTGVQKLCLAGEMVAP